MAAPPRYAFIALEGGMSKRDVFVALSQFGDVKLMSRLSEVSCLMTDLVRNLESEAGAAKSIMVSSVINPQPDTPRPVRITQRCMPKQMTEAEKSIVNRHLKRPAETNQSMMPEPLPVPPPGFSSQPILKRPAVEADQSMPSSRPSASSSPQPINPSSLRSFHPILQSLGSTSQQYQFKGEGPAQKVPKTESEEREMIADIKTEGDSSFTAGGTPVLEEPNEQLVESMDGDGLNSFADEEGNIEMPFAPNFRECRTRRSVLPARHAHGQVIPDEHKPSQARCTVCRRWVKVTDTYTRLIAHVFMHTKKERFVCPAEGCEYSNKMESSVRRHANASHGQRMDPIDFENDRQSQSQSWRVDRCTWAPRCFPDHFEPAPGGDLFMKVNEQKILMQADSFCSPTLNMLTN